MANSIASKSRRIQSQKKPARRRKGSSAPAPPSGPSGPNGPISQHPLFWLLALLASGSAWFAIQQGLLGTLAIFLTVLAVLVLRQNDW